MLGLVNLLYLKPASHSTFRSAHSFTFQRVTRLEIIWHGFNLSDHLPCKNVYGNLPIYFPGFITLLVLTLDIKSFCEHSITYISLTHSVTFCCFHAYTIFNEARYVNVSVKFLCTGKFPAHLTSLQRKMVF